MRRPHRSIETFDISLMAVVTKAMGAFLVLMLILLPGYDPNRETATDLMARLKSISAKIDELAKQLDDPGMGAADLRKNMGKLASEASLSAEVLGKLEALVENAFGKIQSLEAENQAKQREIDALNEELQKLRDKTNDALRSVYVSGFAGAECNDVAVSGVILKSGLEDGYSWLRDSKPIPADLLLYVSWQSKGGEVSNIYTDASDKPYADGPGFKNSAFIGNAFLLTKNDIGIGDYVVIFLKKDKKSLWKAGDLDLGMLSRSDMDCFISVNTAANIQGAWNSDYPRGAVMDASAIAGAFIALTSDDKGITFRGPTAEEHKWTGSLMARSLASQNASQAGKAFMEEQKKKAEAAKKAAEDASKGPGSNGGGPPPTQGEDVLKQLDEIGK